MNNNIFFIPLHLFCKRYILVFMAMLLSGQLLHAQPADKTYIKTTSYLDAEGTRTATSVQYYDGLGRKSVAASNGLAGNGAFSYTMMTYDQKGRNDHSWYPVAGSASLTMPSVDDFASMSHDTYLDDFAFTSSSFDALDRPVSLSIGGQEWIAANRKSTVSYLTNHANDVKRYRVSANGVTQDGYWPAGSLTVESSYDEDRHNTIVYKDLAGNIILSDVAGAYTYYVYDSKGLLRYVLTPMYQDDPDIDEFAYVYNYDNRGRVSSKRLPGCETTFYTYDNSDRILTEQNPLLASKQLKRFFLYDVFGRLCIQGTCSSSTLIPGNVAVQLDTNSAGLLNTGYSATISLNGASLEVASYYDDYSFFSLPEFSQHSNVSMLHSNNLANESCYGAHGEKTGEIVATSNGVRLLNSFFYDSMGRCIEDCHTTLNETYYKNVTSYSFTDKPLIVSKVIPVDTSMYPQGFVGSSTGGSSSDSYTITTSYSYNQYNDELESVSLKYGDNNPVIVSQYEYDAIGRKSAEIRPAINETVAYSHDVHGWTKGISGNFFRENLYYADGSSTKQYNGNIAEQQWWMQNDSISRKYRFSYSNRNMMSNAYYNDNNPQEQAIYRYDERSITYNKNGALTRLYRKGRLNSGTYSYIDRLSYTYDGNKLTSISDRDSLALAYNGAFEYQDNNRNGDDFEYNSAGMLTKDKDKRIKRIVYNNIGLVDSVLFTNGAKIVYTYAMNGEKLRVRRYASTANVITPWAISPVDGLTPIGPGISRVQYNDEDYIGGDVVVSRASSALTQISTYRHYYVNGYAQFFPAFYSTTPQYHYFSTDHLGSVRSVVKANADGTATELQYTHYYPFGGIIADISSNSRVEDRLFNGKELDTTNNLWWYDYGARQYDPAAPRFTTPDPLAEISCNISCYAYCHNNPIAMIDPTGMFDNYFDALDYADAHHAGFNNVHYSEDQKEWYVAYGENGRGYVSGGTLTREFGQERISLETIGAIINNGIDGATNVKNLGENVSIGNNGKFYGINKGPFYGNKSVSVVFAHPIASKISKGCTFVNIGLVGYETHDAFMKDGRNIGTNTKNALGKNFFSWSGAYAGGYYGAELGTYIYPGWGTIIFGVMGAVTGGLGGEYLWQCINNDCE